MKKIILLFLGFILIQTTYSQGDTEKQGRSGKRFFAGVSYSYLDMEMKLSSLSLHSVWYGTDMGIHDLTDEEMDEVNAHIERNSQINALTLHAGMVFLGRPESDWKMSGTIFLGVVQNLTTVENTTTGTREYSFNSGFSKPCLGVGLDVSYRFTDHWGFSMRPYVLGAMGNTAEIKDGVNPDPINFISEKEDKYRTLYLRASLFATYAAGPVTIYAGPGVYYCWSKHEYRRQHTGTESGEVIIEEITPTAVPVKFIDGSIGVSWKIIEALTVYAHAGVGNDLMIDGGIHYNF